MIRPRLVPSSHLRNAMNARSHIRLFVAASSLLAAFFVVAVMASQRAAVGTVHAQEQKPTTTVAAKDATADKSFTAEQVKFFEKQVSPILKNRCLKCHGAEEKIRGNLRLTSRAAVLRGGDLGPAVDLAKPAESMLLSAIEYRDLEMPPSGKLPAAEREVLARWVREGLPWTPGASEDEPPAVPAKKPGVISDEDRNYWAYRPVQRPAVPDVRDPAPSGNPIDRFLAAKLDAAGLALSPRTDRAALIRRATYDLTGLPPTPDAVDEFVADDAPDAYERLIDRLLASPRYGEKWGRHWLDLVRYAETNGYERDNPKPQAWRYRDYVIRSFNQGKSYDQFLREQLAGDELDDGSIDSLIATGYYRLGIWDDEPADRLLAKYDVLDGVVSTTAQVVLGMTLNCARCHDHKRDPILQRDYYRMLAFFRDVTDMNGKNTRMVSSAEDRAESERLQRERSAREAQWYAEIFRLEQSFKQAYAKQTGQPIDDLPSSDLTELTYRFYRDTWESLPDFSSLKHETAGEIANQFISLSPASRNEAIGLVFEARLKVPEAAEYTFDVEAAEGVRLIVDGRTVIDRPAKGRHSAKQAVRLPAGLVPLRLEYFNSYEKPFLRAGWTGPNGERRSLTDQGAGDSAGILLADSRKSPQTWQYTTQKPAADWHQPEFDDRGWQRGKGGFGTRGTPGAVVRTQWNSSDIWLRTTFALDRLPKRLALDIHHDEDVEVYLNGTLVYQAKGYLREYEQVALDGAAREALRVGANVLAVHCRQTGGGQYIDVGVASAAGVADVASLLRRHGPTVLTAEQMRRHDELTRRLSDSQKERDRLPPPGVEVMCVTEAGRAETHVLLRGNPNVPGDKVEPGIPAVLARDSDGSLAAAKLPESLANTSSGKRRALVEWLVSADNPLTSRVLVNRLWHYHFGRGLAPTPNDFGKLGEPPTHPELIDWLASEVTQRNWNVKALQRLILTSHAYQMSSRARPDALAKDPGNSLLWRFPMRRLTAEELRDSVLAASGRLNLQAGGPSVYPPIPPEVLAGQSRPGAGWGRATPAEASRRSVYAHVKRSLLIPILGDHDVADTDSSCPVRYTTTVPTQALGMLNGEFTNEQAVQLAERVEREAGNDVERQVRWASRLVTGQASSDADVAGDLALIQALRERQGLDARAALQQYCLMLLNTNRFAYLD